MTTSNAIDRLLANPDDGCRHLAPDVAVHWYPHPDAIQCMCGEITRNDPPRLTTGGTHAVG